MPKNEQEPWPEIWTCIEAEVGTNRDSTMDTLISHRAPYPGYYICQAEFRVMERVIKAALEPLDLDSKTPAADWYYEIQLQLCELTKGRARREDPDETTQVPA